MGWNRPVRNGDLFGPLQNSSAQSVRSHEPFHEADLLEAPAQEERVRLAGASSLRWPRPWKSAGRPHIRDTVGMMH